MNMLDLQINILHNFFGIIFAIQVLYLIYPTLIKGYFDTNDENDLDNLKSLYTCSLIYFFLSGLINLYEKSYLFIIHHIISIVSIHYALLNYHKNTTYVYFIYQNLLAELSTIFLSIGIICKNINKLPYSVKFAPEIILCLQLIFFIIYTFIRIIYLLPINIKYLLTTTFNNDDDDVIYRYLLPVCFYFMIGLNLYWYVLMIKTIIKTLNNTKQKYLKN
jgi:hypothetical protein